MIPSLTISDFAEFFRAVHGSSPFPWQEKLLSQVANGGMWPDVLDVPTGFGKTAALDVGVFHLALEADRGHERRAPVRIAFVVDRRLVVDDAFERSRRIVDALKNAQPDTVTSNVAQRLCLLASKGSPPLVARRLRGGIPREDDWARTPSQPTILCSTVDQVGSRLLFRGYGVSDSMKPVHAGLIGADCLVLLDEAHLSEPFRQTLKWVNGYKSERWREDNYAAPWSVSLLTATPGAQSDGCFRPVETDYAHDTLKRRWTASKPARLIDIAKNNKGSQGNTPAAEAMGQEPGNAEEEERIDALVHQTLKALKESELPAHPAIAVVVNRVARARAVFDRLQKQLSDAVNGEAAAELILMIGPARPVDREGLAMRLNPIRTGAERTLEQPLVIVATQCIEAGVDIDLDGLLTESAPLDSLRQRFGRLNRAGRPLTPYAAVVGDPKTDKKDPIYGEAITHAWNYLIEHSNKPAGKKSDPIVDFGLQAFAETMAKDPLPPQALAPRSDAPVLLPAHLDLLSQTAPVPNADPEVSLYLHGPNRTADAVTVLWREDVDPQLYPSGERDANTRRLLLLVPPRSAEAIELPVWAVRRWLTRAKADFSQLTDIPGPIPDESANGQKKLVFRWAGDDDRSRWIEPHDISPGCTIVVPAVYGGVDRYGWSPGSSEPATDVADQAAGPFAVRRFVVRVAPQLFDNDRAKDKLAEAIANAPSRGWRELRDAVKEIVQAEAERLRSYPEPGNSGKEARVSAIASALENLDRAKVRKGDQDRVQTYPDAYGEDEDGRPQGVLFLAPLGIESNSATEESAPINTTEDDFAGSLPGYTQLLQEHCVEVETAAERFAGAAGLSEDRIADLKVAAYLHDAGKADPRFQSWLAYGDPLGPDPDKVLAKSGRWLPREARAQSGLPEYWRHEAFSVRLAPRTPRFKEAKDPELVLWLIGTHHGRGRPFFPHSDPKDAEARAGLPPVLDIPEALEAGPGPQSLAYDYNGFDWPALYERLKMRYGVWELARMEAILRLADHRASEHAAHKQNAEENGSR